MSLLEELSDKGAAIAWSSSAAHANVLALGTKDSGGVGFDDYGGVLELHTLNLSGASSAPASTLLGKVKTSNRFASIAWSEMAGKQEFSYGLIAGGMSDGTVSVWDPAKLVANHATPKLTSLQQHSGAVTGLAFNPHKSSSHLLASAGADTSVFITSLDRPEKPNVFVPSPPPNTTKHSAEVTKCAWNTQVGHILATAAGNGQCIVWDLRQKKPWCELRDAARSPIADVAWNPDQGLHILTASGDDNNPVMKLWDLRSSTSLPLATLQGHSQGILSVAWCPNDASLLMSCSKDNRTLMWDLYKLQPVYELPTGSRSHTSTDRGFGDTSQMFAGLGSAASNRRYQIQWSPHIPAVLATCSFDRKVQVFSMAGAGSSSGRPPKWLSRPCGASFGFGGKLVTFSKSNDKSHVVRVQTICKDSSIVESSRSFENALASNDLKSFCQVKEAKAKTMHDKHVWQFMQVIFDANAREQLLSHLGFDAEAIAAEVHKHSAENPDPTPSSASGGKDSAASVFTEKPRASSKGTPRLSEETESSIKKALLVGNFPAAVECCMAAGNFADALLLASCGGADLWTKTQVAYFEKMSDERSYLNIVSAIIKSQLTDFVESSDLSKWQETLAILSTYAKSEEFTSLCEALARRLESQAHNVQSANLCYMCAVNVPKTLSMWVAELQAAGGSASPSEGATPRYKPAALQEFIEKVTIFRHADESINLDPEASNLFAQYAMILAAQGELQTAAKYIAGSFEGSRDLDILRDRLHHATGGTSAGAPAFPFDPSEKAISGSPVPVAQAFSFSDSGAAGATFSSVSAMNALSGSGAQKSGDSNSFTAAPAAVELPLPQGWSQMLDPSSGEYYYYDQNSGLTQWERPAPISTPDPPVPTHKPTLPMSPRLDASGSFAGGDFNHPAVASMSPATFAPMPAAASTQPTIMKPGVPVASHAPAPAPVPAPAPAPVLSPEEAAKAALAVGGDARAVVQSMQSLLSHLESMPLNPPQKKMLAEISKSGYTLFCKIAAGGVEPDVLSRLNTFFHQLAARDTHGAIAVIQELTNQSWGTHKDWLKGLKHSTTLLKAT